MCVSLTLLHAAFIPSSPSARALFGGQESANKPCVQNRQCTFTHSHRRRKRAEKEDNEDGEWELGLSKKQALSKCVSAEFWSGN